MTEKTPLNDIIAARIAERGRITACLYEPSRPVGSALEKRTVG